MNGSNIILELVENRISLLSALTRLLVLSDYINNSKLNNWCLNEINGYSEHCSVPKYRVIKSRNIVYSGFNYKFQVVNQPLPTSLIPKDIFEEITSFEVKNGVSSLKQLAESKDELTRDLTPLSGIVYKHSNSMLQCYEIKQLIQAYVLTDILETIRTKLIQIFMQLDKELGNLDSIDIGSSLLPQLKLDEINENILSYIEYDNFKEELL